MIYYTVTGTPDINPDATGDYYFTAATELRNPRYMRDDSLYELFRVIISGDFYIAKVDDATKIWERTAEGIEGDYEATQDATGTATVEAVMTADDNLSYDGTRLFSQR